MTTAIAVAAVIAFSFALGSVVRYVDGPTLRRWRLSRRWDVSRLAREFVAAADEPLASLRGLTHMINAWERGARRPSERYWLLYLRVFPECASAEARCVDPEETEARPGSVEALPDTAEIDTMDTAPFDAADTDDLHALAVTVKALEQQVAGLAKRLDQLSRIQHGAGHTRDRSERGKARPRYRWLSRSPLWTALLPSPQQ
jgi:hypothetical protein